MSFFSFLQNTTSRSLRRRAQRQPVGRHFRPRLEELEDRRLLSVTLHDFPVPVQSSNVGGVAGITAGPDGNLWFANIGDPGIGMINPTSHASSLFRTPGIVPFNIIVGPDGNLWFNDAAPRNMLGTINPTTHAISVFSLPTTSVFSIAAGPDGNIWFSWVLSSNSQIVDHGMGTFSPTTHAISQFSLSNSGFPLDLAFDPDHNLWFSAPGRSPDGALIGMLGMLNPTTHAVSEFNLPAGYYFDWGGITAGPDGNLWFLDNGPDSTTMSHSAIGMINPTTHAISEFTLPAQYAFAFGEDTSDLHAITPGPDGNLWFTNNGDLLAGIGKIDPSTHTITAYERMATITPTTRNLPPSPWGITAGPDGNMWFTEFGGTESPPGNLLIGEANTPPVAHSFTVNLTSATTTIAVLPHVWAPNGDSLSVTAVSQGQNGTVAINQNGTLTYTLTRLVSGSDSFTYTVVDNFGETTTATVTVTINVPPAADIQVLTSQVGKLPLNAGQINSLTSSLQAAQDSLTRGDHTAAINQLDAFANKVRALVQSGQLDLTLGDLLIQEEQLLIGLL
jgi:streptogramin lyase